MLNNWKGQRVLVVAPHVDDEVHCAGTIHRAILAKADVRCVAFSLCEESLPSGFSADDVRDEWIASMDVLGVGDRHLCDLPVRHFDSRRQAILDELVRHHNEFKPSVVLCPASTDTHQDHCVVYEECERLFKDGAVLGYLHPLNMRVIRADFFVHLSSADMAAKFLSWNCYLSQRTKPAAFNVAWIDYLSRVWGFMGRRSGGRAEAFEFIRGVLR